MSIWGTNFTVDLKPREPWFGESDADFEQEMWISSTSWDEMLVRLTLVNHETPASGACVVIDVDELDDLVKKLAMVRLALRSGRLPEPANRIG